MYVSKIIQDRREELGFSRREIAILLGISRDYYKKIELGLRKPSINIRAELAVILEISLKNLL